MMLMAIYSTEMYWVYTSNGQGYVWIREVYAGNWPCSWGENDGVTMGFFLDPIILGYGPYVPVQQYPNRTGTAPSNRGSIMFHPQILGGSIHCTSRGFGLLFFPQLHLVRAPKFRKERGTWIIQVDHLGYMMTTLEHFPRLQAIRCLMFLFVH